MSEQFNEFGPFAVDEICRIVSVENNPELLGAEVKIVAPPRAFHNDVTGEVWVGYETDLWHGGYIVAPEEKQLRRRRPPASDSSERMFMHRIRDMADKAPQRVGVPA